MDNLAKTGRKISLRRLKERLQRNHALRYSTDREETNLTTSVNLEKSICDGSFLRTKNKHLARALQATELECRSLGGKVLDLEIRLHKAEVHIQHEKLAKEELESVVNERIKRIMASLSEATGDVCSLAGEVKKPAVLHDREEDDDDEEEEENGLGRASLVESDAPQTGDSRCEGQNVTRRDETSKRRSFSVSVKGVAFRERSIACNQSAIAEMSQLLLDVSVRCHIDDESNGEAGLEPVADENAFETTFETLQSADMSVVAEDTSDRDVFPHDIRRDTFASPKSKHANPLPTPLKMKRARIRRSSHIFIPPALRFNKSSEGKPPVFGDDVESTDPALKPNQKLNFAHQTRLQDGKGGHLLTECGSKTPESGSKMANFVTRAIESVPKTTKSISETAESGPVVTHPAVGEGLSKKGAVNGGPGGSSTVCGTSKDKAVHLKEQSKLESITKQTSIQASIGTGVVGVPKATTAETESVVQTKRHKDTTAAEGALVEASKLKVAFPEFVPSCSWMEPKEIEPLPKLQPRVDDGDERSAKETNKGTEVRHFQSVGSRGGGDVTAKKSSRSKGESLTVRLRQTTKSSEIVSAEAALSLPAVNFGAGENDGARRPRGSPDCDRLQPASTKLKRRQFRLSTKASSSDDGDEDWTPTVRKPKNSEKTAKKQQATKKTAKKQQATKKTSLMEGTKQIAKEFDGENAGGCDVGKTSRRIPLVRISTNRADLAREPSPTREKDAADASKDEGGARSMRGNRRIVSYKEPSRSAKMRCEV